MVMSGPNILLVEDDERLAKLMQEYLLQRGMNVDIEARGDDAVPRILAGQYDILILDIMLPGIDGNEVCRRVRSEYAGPIIMLTARDDDVDQIIGLELGADDYVVKPVEPRVLEARIRAHLRRSQKAPTADATQLEFDNLVINQHTRKVHLADAQVKLTSNEFELLWLLSSKAGEILNRDDILSHLRGIDYDGIDRSVDISISRLRKKLGDSGNPAEKIITVRNKGYLFNPDGWQK